MTFRVTGAALAVSLLATATAAIPARQAPPDPVVKVMTEAEYVKAMKELQSLDGTLRDNIEEVARADLERLLLFNALMDARTDAGRMEELLSRVVTFWEARKTADAVAWSRSAMQEAGSIARTLVVLDLESPSTATLAQERLDKICASCHAAHRERLPDGTFRIK